ncbi:MAG TPA: sugar phosphate isomerase/epimerase family protein [Cyclobacteriaceae bacterium]|nr:sugar phosphate isomerase/epimerase family protein [Cyclobacteriaceae bacterium]
MTTYSTRRDFLRSTTLAGLAFATASFDFKKYTPLLSFSTLGCPDWSFETILNFAVENGYGGVELRGIKRQLDLTKCPEFSSKENILATRTIMAGRKIKLTDLGASAGMHHADPTERKKNLDEAKRFIQLAEQMGCPYVRVFPNNFPKDQEKNKTMDLIIKGLHELGDYAKDKGVTVLMETHGDVVHTADIEQIMQSVGHSHVGLVWDIVNMWSVTKEPPAQMYARLKKYIHHLHVKDMLLTDGKEEFVSMGKGNSPIFEAIDILAKDEFKGYYSFEWEKLWHPEIAEPEVVLADYPKAMKRHFES